MITRTQWIWMATILFIETLATTWVVVRLPSEVPMHWNLAGAIDRYGSPWEFELVGPPMTLMVIGLVVGIPLIPSVSSQLARSGSMHGRIGVAIVAGIAAIHLAVLWPIARGSLPQADGPHNVVLIVDQIVSPIAVASGILFMVLGNYMSKVRRNPIFGVRTRDTLSSDFVWERSQRFSGRLFFLLGFAIALSAVLCSIWVNLAVVGIGTLSFCAVSHIYSWRIARDERLSLAGHAHLPPRS